ncbi:MAG: PAS domain-containing sensor histidine kinase [Candidatus Saganbacteria bacterium]|nr:PAS domain-containing sensor histidine kinase [Candidatus Saganbacteria bacterium]
MKKRKDKKTKSKIESSQQLEILRKIFDAIPAMIFFKDKDCRNLFVNQGLADSLRKSKSEIEGKTTDELLPPGQAAKMMRSDRQVMKTGKAKLDILEAFDTPQGMRWAKTVKIPYRDKTGKVIGLIGIAMDVTERIEAEDKLKDANQMKTEFVSSVSHELRTPLTIIKEGISLVLEELYGEINEQQKKLLKSSTDNINRLSYLIDDLLDISRIEAGHVELRCQSMDIVAQAHEVVAEFAKYAENKGIELSIAKAPCQPLFVFADPTRLEEIFMNLIYNSLKFTQKGSVKLEISGKKNCAEVSIVDTGRGIDEEDLPKLFSKFQQFDREPGPGSKGTGLGLAITKGLVELHGGKIWAQSKGLDKGTRFTFTIPKSKNK